MKNKVLKTIGYIVGITWLFTACALDDEVYGMTMLFINDSPLRTGKTRNLAGTKGSGRRAV